MGDGYCIHCEDEDNTIPVEGNFLLTLLCRVDQGILEQLEDSLQEDIEGNCDSCGGERSRQLLDLVLRAKSANRQQRPRVVISIF
jgi:hypothetical protein